MDRQTAGIATLYRTSPVGMDVPAGWYNPSPDWPSDQTITHALASALQSATWDVVLHHPYTGVPEPTSLTMILIGSSILSLRRRPKQ